MVIGWTSSIRMTLFLVRWLPAITENWHQWTDHKPHLGHKLKIQWKCYLHLICPSIPSLSLSLSPPPPPPPPLSLSLSSHFSLSLSLSLSLSFSSLSSLRFLSPVLTQISVKFPVDCLLLATCFLTQESRQSRKRKFSHAPWTRSFTL